MRERCMPPARVSVERDAIIHRAVQASQMTEIRPLRPPPCAGSYTLCLPNSRLGSWVSGFRVLILAVNQVRHPADASPNGL